MINMKKILTVCTSLLAVSVLLCACVSSNSPDVVPTTIGVTSGAANGTSAAETSNAAEETTAAPPMTADPNYVPETRDETAYEIPMPSEERDVWNIEIKFLEVDDRGIWITIYDYDNLGCWFNDKYYILERYEDNTWTQLTKTNESEFGGERCFTIPSKKRSYITSNCLNYFAHLRSDVTFSAGHYRLTKVLSGREFSVEFDYTPE